MRTLALETSGRGGAIALLEDAQIVFEKELPPARRTTQTLAPAIREGLLQADWRPGSVELVAVAIGPGSFTGLRIGVTAAKTFAYATGARLVGVNTLHVIAEQAPDEAEAVLAVLDAQRQELFSARYERSATGEWELAESDRIVGAAQWVEQIPPRCWVTGSGLSLMRDRLPPEVPVVPEAAWSPRAATVGRLGFRRASSSTDTVWSLKPHYLRLSAAEEKVTPSS